MNWIDKVIEVFSPEAALKRQQHQAALRHLSTAKRGFEAAGRGRRTDGWKTNYSLPWEEISRSLPTLRARSIDLANNNPWAKKALEVIANNTVGAGIMPALPKGRISTYWKDWAETTNCDYDGLYDFAGLQWHVMHTIAKSGECLVVRRRVGRGLGLELQVLEGSYLDQSRYMAAINGTSNYTIDGVEFDPTGKRVAYWIYQTNPFLGRATSVKVPAEDVIHLFEVLRPGQIRGVPFGVSAMLRLRDFDEFEDAQLLRQKIAACYAVFVRDSVDQGLPPGTGTANSGSMPETIEPAMIEFLPPGKDVTFADPPGAEGYGEYSRNILLAVSAGYGVPYEALTGDLSNVNFSSGRMGWIEFGRNVQRWQRQILIPRFCAKVWEWFGEYAVVAGASERSRTTISWTPPKREMIDPGKEISAMTDAIRSGLITLPEAVRQLGYEFESQIDEIAEANKLLDAKGVKLVSDPRQFPVKTGPMQADQGSTEQPPKK